MPFLENHPHAELPERPDYSPPITRRTAFAEVVSAKVRAGLIEAKKVVVDGVDVGKKLNELTNKVESQQKTIEDLKRQIEELKKN